MGKRKKVKKFKLEGDAKLIVDLNEIQKLKRDDSDKARSLLSWHAAKGFWTTKQRGLIQHLLRKHKADTPIGRSKYHLYAITDGDSVKLGVSSNIGNRLHSMQTGHPKKLTVLWKFFVGREREPAFKAEKKLHKYCKKFKLRGEWFKSGCMVIVEQFNIKEKMSMQNEQENHDLSILDSSPI